MTSYEPKESHTTAGCHSELAMSIKKEKRRALQMSHTETVESLKELPELMPVQLFWPATQWNRNDASIDSQKASKLKSTGQKGRVSLMRNGLCSSLLERSRYLQPGLAQGACVFEKT
jgi:hypothetical protein